MDDGHNVVRELTLSGGAILARIENCEFDIMFIEDELQEFETESTKSVTVGNHNFCDTSAK